MTAPPLRCPPVRAAEDANLTDEDRVVGVVVEGKARAYALKALSGMMQHVVNDLVDDVPVTVTYCDKSDCVRTFTDKKRGDTLAVSQLGFADGLLIRVGAGSYHQKTGKSLAPDGPPLALPKLDHTVTTWKEWREQHPETEVFTGG
jgi:hypothetical protein